MSMPMPFFPGSQPMGGFKSFSKKGKTETVQDANTNSTNNTNTSVTENINSNTN